MKNNLATALDFSKKAKGLRNRHILQIILFGSVARGEDTSRSDIDIAVIHDLDDVDHLKTKINAFLPDQVQVSYFNKEQLTKEPEIVSALAGEGILLHGRPYTVKLGRLMLKPRVVIAYDTSAMSLSERMKLNRALHGSVSRSSYKGKQYTTKTEGLLSRIGIEKLARGIILAEPPQAAIVVRTLKRHKARCREIAVWM
jgi:predicted nucleotidyltransferase